MKGIQISNLAMILGISQRGALKKFHDKIILVNSKGAGGRVAFVPDFLLKDVSQLFIKNYIQYIPLNKIIELRFLSIIHHNNLKRFRALQSISKTINNYFYFFDEKKTIVCELDSWFVDDYVLAKTLSYKKSDNIHVKANRNSWGFKTIQGKGGLKKYYLVSTLAPEDAYKVHCFISKKLNDKQEEQNQKTKLFDKANQDEQQRALIKEKAVAESNQYRKGKPSKVRADREFVRKWNAKHKDVNLSYQSLNRYRKNYCELGLDGLVRKPTRTKRKRRKFDKAAQDYLKKIWLEDSQRNIKHCIEKLKYHAKIRGWTIPSDTTLWRFLKSLRNDITTYARNGKKAFEDLSFASIHRDRDLQPGEMAVGDAKMVKVSYGSGKEGERFYIFVWADHATKKVLSVVDSDSGNDAQAVLDGVYLMNLEHKHTHVYMDHGKDFVEAGYTKKDSELPENLHAPLETLYGKDNVHFARVKNAKTKIIERIFRDSHQNCDKEFRGYCGANIMERPDSWHLKRKSFMTRAQLVDAIKKFFFEIYNNWSPNGDLTPNEKWNEYFEVNPKHRVESTELLRHLLLRTYPRLLKVGRHGIQFG